MTDIFFGLIGRAHLWGRGSTLLSYSQWTSDQDQSSHTVVSWHPTKRQSWSRAGFTKSYRTNNNTSFTNTANIVKISPSLLSQSCIGKTQLWGRRPPLFHYSQWLSDQGQISRTIVTQRPTKPQSQSSAGLVKSYRTFTNTALTNTSTIVKSHALSFLSLIGKAQLWERQSPLLCCRSDQGQSSGTGIMRHPIKPQSQSSMGFAKLFKTNSTSKYYTSKTQD